MVFVNWWSFNVTCPVCFNLPSLMATCPNCEIEYGYLFFKKSSIDYLLIVTSLSVAWTSWVANRFLHAKFNPSRSFTCKVPLLLM